MCYSTAKGTTKEGQNAISRGVLVLLLPPVAFMTLGAGMAIRYSKKRDEENGQNKDRSPSNDLATGSPRTRPGRHGSACVPPASSATSHPAL